MSKNTSDWVHRLQYVALRCVAMLLYCWPVNANLVLGRFIGDCLYFFDARHRKRAMANLQRSFPEKSAAEHRRLARRSMQELIMFFIEELFMTRLVRIETWRKYIRLDGFQEALRMLIARESGVILVTAHYGSFEVSNYLLGTLGFETTSIGRPLDNPYINDWVMAVREKQGGRIIDKKGASSEVTTVLENKGVVGFVADQNAGAKGIFVDFFGRKASTYKSIALLAMEYRAPIVVGFARRIDDTFRFDVGVQDIIRPADWDNEPNPIHYITQRFSRGIEAFIRVDPGQYWWVHRRWKSRPKGEPPEPYD